MLLCDRVANGPHAQVSSAFSTAVAVNRELAEKVGQSPVRYILSDPVYDNILFAAVEQPDCLWASLRTLRVPHPLMWVEWRELRQSEPQQRTRAGVLIESNDAGRSGTLTSAWLDATSGPYRAPAFFSFDFDQQVSGGLAAYNVDRSDPHLYSCYDQLYKHSAFHAYTAWLKQLETQVCPADMRLNLNRLFSCSVRDFALMCAFLTLLTQPRVLEARGSDLSRLNSARAKKGKNPLLSHVELHMRLDAPAFGEARMPGADRHSSRLHWVRGHLVHRSDRVFWRRSHTRGDVTRGVLAKKTVHVEGGASNSLAAE